METSENQAQDAFQAWSESQKAWLRLMNTAFTGFSKPTEDTEGKYDWANLWRANYDIYNQWLNTSQEMIKQTWKGSSGGADKTVFNGMLDATNIYNKMYEFWDGATKILSGEVTTAKDIQKHYEEFCDLWLKNYNRFFDAFFASAGIEPLKSFGVGMYLPKMYTDLLLTFMTPWMEASQGLPQKSLEALRKGPQGYADIYRLWLPAYEQSWSKILKMPPMGITRQSIERLQKLTETMMEHNKVMTDYSETLYKVGAESMQQVAAKLGEMYVEGHPPKTYREFYTLWWTTSEDTLYRLFKTQEFSRLIGRLIDVTMRLRQRYNSVMEEFIKALPIPTRSEMDDLYKIIYLMNKEVKDNPKRLRELEEKLRTTEATLSKQVKNLEDRLEAKETAILKQANVRERKSKGTKAEKELS